jgi:ABC-type lipoprotein release transport system permease subunit
MTAVIIGVWSMIFLGALMRGVADQMVRNGISTLTGHIQIHQKGYRSDPVIENRMDDPDLVTAALNRVLPAGARWTTRIRVTAVASNARHTAGIILVGMDPQKEAGLSFIGRAVHQGRFLESGDPHGILVGKALADKLETRLGHKLVLMAQDTHRKMASRAFRIRGIYTAEMEETEKRFVFVTLAASRRMLKLNNGISEVSVLLSDRHEVAQAASGLRTALSATGYEVLTWQELLPLVTAVLEMYDGFIFLWFLVVFVAMAFGIVNTTLMAVFERIREFGLLRALGMKPVSIVGEVLVESFFLITMGMVVGNGLGFISVLALSGTGIDLSSLAAGAEFAGMGRVIYPILLWMDVVIANLVVFVLGILVSLYPAIKAARFTPVEAMAHT